MIYCKKTLIFADFIRFFPLSGLISRSHFSFPAVRPESPPVHEVNRGEGAEKTLASAYKPSRFPKKTGRGYGKIPMPAVYLLLAIFLLLPGCSKKPPGFPKLVPCKIKVICEGEPVSNAVVMLIPEESSSAVSVNIAGRTSVDGAVEMGTSLGTYIQKGVPTGKYLVTIRQEPVIELSEELKAEREKVNSQEAFVAWSEKTKEAARAAMEQLVVPPVYETKETSPLRLEISGATEETIEVDHN